MSKAPIGAIVSIGYEADPGVHVKPGDILLTPTQRTYRVLTAKRARRGNRYAIRAMVIEGVPAFIDIGHVHELHWNPRKKKEAPPTIQRPPFGDPP